MISQKVLRLNKIQLILDQWDEWEQYKSRIKDLSFTDIENNFTKISFFGWTYNFKLYRSYTFPSISLFMSFSVNLHVQTVLFYALLVLFGIYPLYFLLIFSWYHACAKLLVDISCWYGTLTELYIYVLYSTKLTTLK